MLIPQFSIRWLFAITAVAAVIFSIVALGVRGNHWAAAVSAGLLALAVLVILYGLLFFIVWLFSVAMARRGPRGVSPFAPAPAAGKTETPATPIVLE
ncbi:MAG: hypothetical protein HUU20_09385 [Pirellulales bacterium]|nr:hypothetical protein [Pirellulales bacterium]